MKNEFTLAFNEVLEEKGLPKEVILSALESAMVSAYRRAVNASSAQHVEAQVDPETGKVIILAEKEVVDSVQDERTEVSLIDARRVSPEAELGAMVVVESTPRDFGRVAAQTARQVIQQRIRDAERQMQMAFFEKQLGEIVSGVVQAINNQGLTIGMEMRAEGNMSRKDMIPGERFRIHDRVRALIAEVKDSPRGPQIILSRTHRDFLRRLLENEVPEIYHGIVEIRSIAREPGERAKVAVSATQAGIDPVGACVGVKGVRIQAIVRELHDEKIDVIEWNTDPAFFIAKAISPARVSGVYLNEKSPNGKTATVVVPEDQLSLAIGRDGQNARLAAKLTGWRIDIKSVSEAASDALYKIQNDEALAALIQLDGVVENIQAILAKKAENRPLTPEEYDQLSKFIDKVEHRTAARTVEKKPAEEAAEKALRELFPETIFLQDILDSGLPEHVAYILQEAGYTTTGDLVLTIKTHSDDILRLQGIGPRAMNEINKLVDSLEATKQAAVQGEAEAVAEVEPAAVQPEVEPVLEEAVSTAPEVVEEAVAQPEEIVEFVPQIEEPVVVPEGEVEPLESEEEPSFDKLFALKPDMIPVVDVDDEEESEDSAKTKPGKKKKKSRKSVEITYDPDRDMMLTKKKHKRGDGVWEWDE
jgi:N utilization substance protein A